MSSGFIETPQFKSVIERSLVYIQAGYAVHFSGPTGIGKTALALHIAGLLGRPLTLLHGNDEYKPSDLVGGNYGIRKKKVVDNYIHNVWKTEESLDQIWYDGRLTEACRLGYTMIYDEFNRSRPETNNILLSVLQEGILDLSTYKSGETHLKVHPDFALILTSNPEEYAGVHSFQDALRDRVITIDLQEIAAEAEVAIVSARSGLFRQDAKTIVEIIRIIRGKEIPKTSIRASIMTAKILSTQGSVPSKNNLFFITVLQDVLASEFINFKIMDHKELRQRIEEGVMTYFLQTKTSS